MVEGDSIWLGSHLGPGFISQRSGKITLTGGAGDRDDQFAGILRTLSDPDGSDDIGTCANANKQALLGSKAACHCKGIVVADLNALDDLGIPGSVLEVQILRHKPGASSLNFVRARLNGFTGKSLIDDW